jgi:formyl-CoA transferase
LEGGAPRQLNAPTGAYQTRNGWIMVALVREEQYVRLVGALGRPDLADDPRFATNAARVAHMDETDALVEAWTRTLPKMEVFARTKAYRVPCAPVRTVTEVIDDPHLHARGSLQWIDHPEYGRIVVPTTPLRFGGEDAAVPYRASAGLGADTAAILEERLSLDAKQVEELRAQQVL